MVPGLKFSTRTSLFRASVCRIRRPSGALRFKVTLFLFRLTDMKYVDSPPTNGGQLRVSSPLPGSSSLITSAPMSPSIIVQNGPARTRVRSRTRTPASGALLLGMLLSFPDALGETAGDGVHALARAAGAPPEQPGAGHGAEVREVIDVVDGFDGHARADLQPFRLSP